jgi:acyl-CoA reductase-like NAD-dependent aldehyde dehydrogenase
MDIPYYVNGKFCKSSEKAENRGMINNYYATVHHTPEWKMVSAVDQANTFQHTFNKTSFSILSETLKRAMDYYFTDEEDLKFISGMTGSPLTFVRQKMEETKEWARHSKEFLESAIGSAQYSSSPTFVVLPSNSEQESLFVIAQALAARSSLIVRPSSTGCSSFTSIRFAEAWKTAADEMGYGYLDNALSVVNTTISDEMWDIFSVKGWNYVLFGSKDTVGILSNNLTANGVDAGDIVCYGLGFSGVIVDQSTEKNIEELADELLKSCSINRGNECVASDVAYVHESIYEDLLKALSRRASEYRSLHPFDPKSIGMVSEPNVSSIEDKLVMQSKQQYLNTGTLDGRKVIHASVIPISRYEFACELPGPILYVKRFSDMTDVLGIMDQELEANGEDRFLVMSVYSSNSFFSEMANQLRTHKVRHNKPCHDVDLYKPHQGIVLLERLVDQVLVEN